MKSVPGYKPWHASFMGFTTQTDWDHTNGGVILFDDGTIWSYDCEGPVNGEGYSWNYPDGLSIVERKPAAGVWERLTPDVWGQVYEGQPPGYSEWPSPFTDGLSGRPNPWEADFSGPLAVAAIGNWDNDWRHIHDGGDDVWFYSEDNDSQMGLVKVNRHTRTWERFITSRVALDIYDNKMSRISLWGEYFWFLGMPESDCGQPDGVNLYRADRSNPDNVVSVHEWPVLDISSTNTWDLDVAAWLPTGLRAMGHAMTIDDDGYMYVGTRSTRYDSRTVYASDATARNYSMDYSFMMRCNLAAGDYDFELLLWHDSQGFVGYGQDGSYYGTYNWATVGIDTEPGAFNSERTEEPRGMGFYPAHWHDVEYRDGWLYWIDQSGYYGGAYGTSKLLCRMRIADYTSPTKHDPLNPSFEVIGNGTVPWEGNAGHLVRYGDFNFWFDGASPVLPYPDNTMTFDSDGNIIWKCITFPGYQSAGGSPFQFWPPEYPHRALIKLSPPEDDIVQVTMTFTGTSLTGYGNVREVKADNTEIILRLGGANG